MEKYSNRYLQINEEQKNQETLILVTAIPQMSLSKNFIIDNFAYYIFDNVEDAKIFIVNSVNQDLNEYNEDVYEDYKDIMKVDENGDLIFTTYEDVEQFMENNDNIWTYRYDEVKKLGKQEYDKNIILARSTNKYNL